MHGRFSGVVFVLIAVLPLAAAQCKPQDGHGPYLSVVRHVRFDDSQTLTTSDTKAIAHDIIGLCFNRNTPDQMAERIRDAFQRHGFFKAEVLGPVRVTVIDARVRPFPVDLATAVNVGERYRVGDVQFHGNKAFDAETLRRLIPLNAGDIFDIEKVRQGLKGLRELYGDHGYINYTPVPDTRFNETNRTITLTLDCDEGAQFRIAGLRIDAPAALLPMLHNAWKLKKGKVYRTGYLQRFFAENKELIPPGASPELNTEISTDEKTKTLIIHLQLCPSDQDCVQE